MDHQRGKHSTEAEIQPTNMMKTSPNLFAEASFMGLPTEIRQLIYPYLVPDSTFELITEPTRSGTPWQNRSQQYTIPCQAPGRDGKPRTTAILRTNRKIYQEAVDLFYTSMLHRIEVVKCSLKFANQTLRSVSSLPPMVRLIQDLTLSIQIRKYYYNHAGGKDNSNYIARKEDLPHFNLVKEVADLFSPTGPGNLEDLKLVLYCKKNFWVDLLLDEQKYHKCLQRESTLTNAERTARRARMRKIVEFNFDSLKRIRVSRDLTVEWSGTLPAYFCDLQLMEDINRVIVEYVQQLKSEIQPVDMIRNELGRESGSIN